MNTTVLLPQTGAGQDQFRLRRIQTFNWGTFSGLFDFLIAERGYLFVGPSGSGKSTVLDAHAALLTPPKWLDFNVAAREAEKKGRDRNLMTYVRGAWAEQTGESGEVAKQFLRPDTTWSAIAATYTDGTGKTVVLCQLLWIRGRSTANNEVRKLFVILERPFELRELEFFPAIDFDVRQFKQKFPEFVRDEFSPYQERFRRLLGIDNESALRLLHKTQSAKNLGDLNTFLRDFMLDAPQTFDVATTLVNEFGELNAAHQAVVAARLQIETLQPARDNHSLLEEVTAKRAELVILQDSLDTYRKTRRKELLILEIERLKVDAEVARANLKVARETAQREEDALRDLEERRREQGGRLIEQLEKQLREAEDDRTLIVERRGKAAEACRALDWTMPERPEEYLSLAREARQRVANAEEERERREQERDALKEQARVLGEKLQLANKEIQALEGQRTNIPSRLLAIRHALAVAIDVPEERVPFAGELIEVKADESRWQGAIERVLRSFALSILVEDKLYPTVVSFLDRQNIHERLLYLRVQNEPTTLRAVRAGSVPSKLTVAPSLFRDWIQNELRARFEYQCVESEQEFRGAQQAVTQHGQVKHGTIRHEKDDRFAVDDRKRWVLGADNERKLKLYKDEGFQTAQELTQVTRLIERSKEHDAEELSKLFHCQTLTNLKWPDVDVASSLAKIESFMQRIESEQAARPNLAELAALISKQGDVFASAAKTRTKAEIVLSTIDNKIEKFRCDAAQIAAVLQGAMLPDTAKSALDVRFQHVAPDIDLELLSEATLKVQRTLNQEHGALTEDGSRLTNAIEEKFKDFGRQWPAEAGGLDAAGAGAAAYFAKLERLQKDALPKYEQRFRSLLREQSDQNLMLLSTHLDQERKAIRDRMELVNESLKAAEFNAGSHLIIETADKMLDDVRTFKQHLKDALSHSLSSDPAAAEQRFSVLQALVKRLSSKDASDEKWRSIVLDVRQHVEFIAKEVDIDGVELEVYRSGAGKSGGQRQKLAATCLAAALRYQLGGRERGVPMFSTIAIDEAFDKADPDFTTLAMNIFKEFGFQMIVATPLKSVMALEPFIGGACFVHIRDRKTSSAVPIEYSPETQRLILTANVDNAKEAAAS
jgi:uncharacterized protein YPO0396